MSEPTQPGAPESAPAPEPVVSSPEPAPAPAPPEFDGPLSARDAAKLISGKPDDAGPAPQEPVPGEPTEEPDPAPDEPPIKPPRSWSKENKEAFAALPRHIQQAVADNERAREADFSQRARAAAEQQKAIEAQAQAVEQARQQYEQALPVLMQNLNSDYQAEFGNPSWDQIKEWSHSDPAKYVRWQAAYNRAQAVAGELREQQAREAEDLHRFREAYLQEQNRLLAEAEPEWADPKAITARQGEILSYLQDIGFPREQLEAHTRDFVPLSIHDYRFVRMALDGARYRAAQQATRKAAPRPDVPPVQRPGTPPVKGEARATRLRDLSNQLDRSGDARDAGRMIAALLRS